MGRHRTPDEPPTEAVTEIQPVWVDESTRTGPRTRSLILVAAATMATLVLFTVIMALVPGDPPPDPEAGPSTVEGTLITSTVDSTTYTTASAAPAISVSSAAGLAPAPRPSATTGTTPAATSGSSSAPPTTMTTSAPAPTGGVTGTYALVQSWSTGFIAWVALTNPTATAQDWQVVLEYPATVTAYQTSWSTAPVAPLVAHTARTATITSQATLGAGQSVGVWVQFGNQGSGISPTRCTVNGANCA